MLALIHNIDTHSFSFNIFTQNSLSKDVYKNFKEVIDDGGFDIVLGNPPYVKYQDILPNYRKELIDTWSTTRNGNYNLYFAFFELGIGLLKKDGKLGYIVPNSYFTSIAAFDLRRYLADNKLLSKIIDFTHLKLFSVLTYTCITFLTKEPTETFSFEKIDTYEDITNLDNIRFSTIRVSDLRAKKWRLLRDKDQKNIKIIENMPNKLGDFFDIKNGIATCSDNIYFVDRYDPIKRVYLKKYESKDYYIEATITRPIVKISDFDTQEDINSNNRNIIFPYRICDGKVKIIPEDEFRNKYPGCYAYLLAVKPVLLSRDKGKKEYASWYAYARTQ